MTKSGEGLGRKGLGVNGVQEALSSNLSTRTKSPENESFQDFFYLFQRHLLPAISCDIIGQLKQYDMAMKELEVLYEAKGCSGAGGFGRGGPVRPGGRLPHLSHLTGPGHAARVSGGLL